LFSSRRRHTRSKRDWSSDVCSSDLFSSMEIPSANKSLPESYKSAKFFSSEDEVLLTANRQYKMHTAAAFLPQKHNNSVQFPEMKIGRASCRERVKHEARGVIKNKGM